MNETQRVLGEMQIVIERARIRDASMLRGLRWALALALYSPAVIQLDEGYEPDMYLSARERQDAIERRDHALYLKGCLDRLRQWCGEDWEALRGTPREDVWAQVESVLGPDEPEQRPSVTDAATALLEVLRRPALYDSEEFAAAHHDLEQALEAGADRS